MPVAGRQRVGGKHTQPQSHRFRDFDCTAWYAEAVSAAVDNGLLYGKSSTIIDPERRHDPRGDGAIINRSFGCYKTADISQYNDVSKSKWYYKDVALAVQMGTYNGRSASAMAPDSPISRQEAMTVVARALELDYDSYSKTDLSAFSDRSEISNWALPYVRAMVGADYIHGRGKVLAPLDNITWSRVQARFFKYHRHLHCVQGNLRQRHQGQRSDSHRRCDAPEHDR